MEIGEIVKQQYYKKTRFFQSVEKRCPRVHFHKTKSVISPLSMRLLC